MAIKKNKQVEKHMAAIEDARLFFEELAQKKQESYDNKSEKWQEGDKGQEEQENISSLEDITNSLESVHGDIENLFEE